MSAEELNQKLIEAYNRGWKDGYETGLDDALLFEKDMERLKEEALW